MSNRYNTILVQGAVSVHAAGIAGAGGEQIISPWASLLYTQEGLAFPGGIPVEPAQQPIASAPQGIGYTLPALRHLNRIVAITYGPGVGISDEWEVKVEMRRASLAGTAAELTVRVPILALPRLSILDDIFPANFLEEAVGAEVLSDGPNVQLSIVPTTGDTSDVTVALAFVAGDAPVHQRMGAVLQPGL